MLKNLLKLFLSSYYIKVFLKIKYIYILKNPFFLKKVTF